MKETMGVSHSNSFVAAVINQSFRLKQRKECSDSSEILTGGAHILSDSYVTVTGPYLVTQSYAVTISYPTVSRAVILGEHHGIVPMGTWVCIQDI